MFCDHSEQGTSIWDLSYFTFRSLYFTPQSRGIIVRVNARGELRCRLSLTHITLLHCSAPPCNSLCWEGPKIDPDRHNLRHVHLLECSAEDHLVSKSMALPLSKWIIPSTALTYRQPSDANFSSHSRGVSVYSPSHSRYFPLVAHFTQYEASMGRPRPRGFRWRCPWHG